MSREGRKGHNFSDGQKRKAIMSADHRCLGCGERGTVQVHHDPPICQGGGKSSTPTPLHPRCHQLADELALRYRVGFRQVVERMGSQPFRGFDKSGPRKGRRSPIRQVLRRFGK